MRSPRHAHSPYSGSGACDVFTRARYRRHPALARQVRSEPTEEAATQLRTDRTYDYPFGVAELWERLRRVDAYATWWPWLREFDGTTLAAGESWQCLVQPPLPYTVRFTVRLDEVVDGDRVAATIDGDISGTATLQVHTGDGDDGSRLRLVAALAPRKPSMVALSFAARPLVTFGHHWVLDTGARQFAEGLGRSAG